MTQPGSKTVTYTYDENGNRVSADADIFAYDWRDRLSEATVDSTTVDYTDAGDDLRATRDDGTTTTDYLWDRIGGLPQLVSDGATDYVWGADGLSAEINATGDATTPLLDLLGSIRLRTDDTATVVGSSDFEVFGGLRAQFGAHSSLGWTGELRDADTGLMYLRARDYSSGSGRFLQRDSVNPSGPGTQGYQRYAYASGNPATLTDPSGHNAAALGGQIDFSIDVQLTKDSLRYGLMALGSAPPLLVIGAFVSANLGLLIVILAVILITIGIMAWCHQHGCSMPSFDIQGWMKGTVTAGSTAIQMGVAAATGTAARACAATLGALDPLGNKTRIVGGCPIIPRPGRDDDDDDQCRQDSNDLDPTDIPEPESFGVDGDSGTLVSNDQDDDNDDGGQLPSGPVFRGRESKRAIDEIAKRAAREYDLNKAGQRELHDRITKQNLSPQEVMEEAEQVAKENPGKYTNRGARGSEC